MSTLRHTATAVLVVLAAAAATPHNSAAQVPDSAPRAAFRFGVGWGLQDLGDLNKGIEDDERIFHSYGIPVDWDTFGGALEISGGADVWVTDAISLGATVGLQQSSVQNLYSDISGSVSDNIDLKLVDVSATLTFWAPAAQGLFVGASLGKAFGWADSRTKLRIYGEPSSNIDLDGEFSGEGLSVGVFLGYQGKMGKNGLIYGMAGYRHRNLGEFDGTLCTPSGECVDAKPSNNAGQAMDFDFSGLYIRGGFGLALGGRGRHIQ